MKGILHSIIVMAFLQKLRRTTIKRIKTRIFFNFIYNIQLRNFLNISKDIKYGYLLFNISFKIRCIFNFYVNKISIYKFFVQLPNIWWILTYSSLSLRSIFCGIIIKVLSPLLKLKLFVCFAIPKCLIERILTYSLWRSIFCGIIIKVLTLCVSAILSSHYYTRLPEHLSIVFVIQN